MPAPPPRPSLRPPRHAGATVRDLRGGLRLAMDGARAAIGGLETLHARLSEVSPPVRGLQPGRPDRGWPAVVYRGLRGTSDVVGSGLDLLLASAQAALQDPRRTAEPAEPLPTREAVVAALNALAGDHLHRTDNPLAVALQLRLPRAPAQPRVLVLVHDLGLNDLHWHQGDHDHGEFLAARLEATPAYVHYNTGRAVWASGRELAAALEQRLGGWPVPLQGIALLGHGLGGLVLRSALHQATRAGMGWPAHVRDIVFLGTPHGGATLGRGRDLLGQAGLAAQRLVGPLARLAGRRSDGIDDFLQGRWFDAAAPGEAQAAPWPPEVRPHAVAGALGDGAGESATDGLVTVASALGRAPAGSMHALDLPESHRWVAPGLDHLGLLRSPAVAETMRSWLAR